MSSVTSKTGWNMTALCGGLAVLACGSVGASWWIQRRHRPCARSRNDLSPTMQQSKRRIGILCGSGPEAGIDLFEKLLRLHRAKLGSKYRTDKDAPDIVVLSVSSIGGPRSANDLIRGTMDCQRTWHALRRAIVEMAPLVDCFCICCHQLHFFESDIRQLLDSLGEPTSKFVSMVTVTMTHCQNQQLSIHSKNVHKNEWIAKKLAILGGPITTDLIGRSPYKRLAEALPDMTLALEDRHRNRLLDIIKAVKQKGPQQSIVIQFETFIRELQDQFGVQTIVLACTEFPLLPVKHTCEAQGRVPPTIHIIDPTELVALEMLSRTQQY